MFESTTVPTTTTSSTTSPPTKRRTRSVSFDCRVFVKRTLHLNNYTDGEINACWYNRREFSRIRDDAASVVEYWMRKEEQKKNRSVPPKHRANTKNKEDDDTCSCLRGLDMFTPQGRARRMGNRQMAWTAVLDEQDHQIENGTYEPNMIAEVYRPVSNVSQVAAQIAANQDASEVVWLSSSTIKLNGSSLRKKKKTKKVCKEIHACTSKKQRRGSKQKKSFQCKNACSTISAIGTTMDKPVPLMICPSPQ